MKILYVVNNYYAKGNGLSASARRTVQALKERGAEVRVLSGPNPEAGGPQPDYPLPDGHLPIVDPIVRRQGYQFAHKDRRVMAEAVDWADLVHLEEPFGLEMAVCRMCRARGIPCTATYHLHPENLFASAHLQHSRFFNGSCMLVWRDFIFNRCEAVQCPTRNAMQRAERFRFTADLRLISNGLIPREAGAACEPPVPLPEGAPVVMCAGRYSVEKDQPTLLRAMRWSRHAKEIQLVFCGRGPTERHLKRMAERLVREGVLTHPPVFGFFSYDELMAFAQRASLYIHCATVEVEGLSCSEVLKEGVVPVIAEDELTATPQFARSPESVFPAGDAQALAQRIDAWLDDPDRLREEGRKYLDIQRDYDLNDTADRLMDLYREVVAAAPHPDRRHAGDERS